MDASIGTGGDLDRSSRSIRVLYVAMCAASLSHCVAGLALLWRRRRMFPISGRALPLVTITAVAMVLCMPVDGLATVLHLEDARCSWAVFWSHVIELATLLPVVFRAVRMWVLYSAALEKLQLSHFLTDSQHKGELLRADSADSADSSSQHKGELLRADSLQKGKLSSSDSQEKALIDGKENGQADLRGDATSSEANSSPPNPVALTGAELALETPPVPASGCFAPHLPELGVTLSSSRRSFLAFSVRNKKKRVLTSPQRRALAAQRDSISLGTMSPRRGRSGSRHLRSVSISLSHQVRKLTTWFIQRENYVQERFQVKLVMLMLVAASVALVGGFLPAQRNFMSFDDAESPVFLYGPTGEVCTISVVYVTGGVSAICFSILAMVLVKTRHIEDGYGIKRELALILANSLVVIAVALSLQGAVETVVVGFMANNIVFITVTWPVILSFIHQRRIEGRDVRVMSVSRRSGEPLLREILLNDEFAVERSSFEKHLVREFAVENLAFFQASLAFEKRSAVPVPEGMRHCKAESPKINTPSENSDVRINVSESNLICEPPKRRSFSSGRHSGIFRRTGSDRRSSASFSFHVPTDIATCRRKQQREDATGKREDEDAGVTRPQPQPQSQPRGSMSSFRRVGSRDSGSMTSVAELVNMSVEHSSCRDLRSSISHKCKLEAIFEQGSRDDFYSASSTSLNSRPQPSRLARPRASLPLITKPLTTPSKNGRRSTSLAHVFFTEGREYHSQNYTEKLNQPSTANKGKDNGVSEAGTNHCTSPPSGVQDQSTHSPTRRPSRRESLFRVIALAKSRFNAKTSREGEMPRTYRSRSATQRPRDRDSPPAQRRLSSYPLQAKTLPAPNFKTPSCSLTMTETLKLERQRSSTNVSMSTLETPAPFLFESSSDIFPMPPSPTNAKPRDRARTLSRTLSSSIKARTRRRHTAPSMEEVCAPKASCDTDWEVDTTCGYQPMSDLDAAKEALKLYGLYLADCSPQQINIPFAARREIEYHIRECIPKFDELTASANATPPGTMPALFRAISANVGKPFQKRVSDSSNSSSNASSSSAFYRKGSAAATSNSSVFSVLRKGSVATASNTSVFSVCRKGSVATAAAPIDSSNDSSNSREPSYSLSESEESRSIGTTKPGPDRQVPTAGNEKRSSASKSRRTSSKWGQLVEAHLTLREEDVVRRPNARLFVRAHEEVYKLMQRDTFSRWKHERRWESERAGKSVGKTPRRRRWMQRRQ